MLYIGTSEFLEPENVKFDINIVIFGQRNAKLGRIRCIFCGHVVAGDILRRPMCFI